MKPESRWIYQVCIGAETVFYYKLKFTTVDEQQTPAISEVRLLRSAAQINSPQTNLLTDGLVGSWTFNGPDMDWSQTAAEARDVSGNANHGDVINGAKPAAGKVGQGLSFDGVDDWVDLPNGNTYLNVNAGTIALWYKAGVNSYTTNHVLYDYNVGGCDGIGINFLNWAATAIIAGHFVDCIGTGDSIQTTVDNWADGQNNWHFFVYTWDVANDTLATFYDGTYKTQADDLDTGTLDAGNSAIGSSHTGSELYYNGLIDEVRVYNRALSADEIGQLYRAGARKMQIKQ